MTDEESSQKSANETSATINLFMQDLDVDENVASILVQEGFSNLEEVAYVPQQELLEVEEFDQELVEELRNRARDRLLTKAIALEETIDMADPEQDLLDMEGMDEHTARMLASKGIKSMEDLAEQAADDLVELEIEVIDEERAKTLIMTARAPWFESEEQ